MATMKNVKKTLINTHKNRPKVDIITCYKCLRTYTVSTLDLFFACYKCGVYIRYMCDVCDTRIKVLNRGRYVKCVKCDKIVCRHCAKLFYTPFYIDGKMESICIKCDIDINHV